MVDLRNYISQIKKSKDLKTVKTKVSTKFEIAGITAKVDGSHAVLFENIKESNFNLIANFAKKLIISRSIPSRWNLQAWWNRLIWLCQLATPRPMTSCTGRALSFPYGAHRAG